VGIKTRSENRIGVGWHQGAERPAGGGVHQARNKEKSAPRLYPNHRANGDEAARSNGTFQKTIADERRPYVNGEGKKSREFVREGEQQIRTIDNKGKSPQNQGSPIVHYAGSGRKAR